MSKNKSQKKINLSNITQKWVDLMLPFAEDYSNRMTESELARKSKVPQQSASRYLSKLVALNLINYEKQGRNKLFYLDLKNQSARIMLNIIESYKSLQFCIKNREMAIIISEILKYCESLIIFGSYASGNFTNESDSDIVVLGKHYKEQIKKIKQKQIIEINEHYSEYNKFKKILASKNPLAIEIMKNHLLFGDISKIIDIFLRTANERR